MKKISLLVSFLLLFSFGSMSASANSSGHVVVMKTMKKVVKKVVGKKMEKKVMEKNETGSGPMAHPPGASAIHTVVIENFAFGPAAVTVKKGESVEFVQKDSAGHTVTADDGSTSGLSSPLLSKGQSYKFTFNTVGMWTYHCGPHPEMKGTVVVME